MSKKTRRPIGERLCSKEMKSVAVAMLIERVYTLNGYHSLQELADDAGVPCSTMKLIRALTRPKETDMKTLDANVKAILRIAKFSEEEKQFWEKCLFLPQRAEKKEDANEHKQISDDKTRGVDSKKIAELLMLMAQQLLTAGAKP